MLLIAESDAVKFSVSPKSSRHNNAEESVNIAINPKKNIPVRRIVSLSTFFPFSRIV